MRKQILLIVCGLLFTLGVSAQLGANGFYRIRNANTSTSNDRLSLIFDELNYRTILSAGGGGSGVLAGTFDTDKALASAVTFLKKDIKIVQDYYGDPSTVFYVKKNGNYGTEYDVQSQGTGLHEIATGSVTLEKYGISVTVDIDDIYANIIKEANEDYYVASVRMYKEASFFGIKRKVDMGTAYFQDQNGSFGIATSNVSSDMTTKWYIEPVTSDGDNFFAAKPADKMKEGGKYYTSLTTAFAYEIVGDVNAYIVTGVEQKDGKQVATMKLVGGQGKIIPAYTPVILECTSTDPALNKLQPTTSAGNVDVSGNKLHGVLLKNKYKSSDNATLAAITKPTRLRVFNVNNSGKVGFYKYSGTDLSANKVYLDMADFANASSNEFDGTFTMDFSQTVSGVNEVHVEETVKDDRYYDLQGRVVEHPTRGIYIRNGRKVYVN